MNKIFKIAGVLCIVLIIGACLYFVLNTTIPKASFKVNTPPKSINVTGLESNEAGEVMILMYHKFEDAEKDQFTRTFDNFRKDITTLYDKGFRPVSLTDYLSGNFNIPKGTTPFVITFDDASYNQFSLIEENGTLTLNPKSAAAILIEFSKTHPDFKGCATFFANNTLFNGSKGTINERLEKMKELGFALGNHTEDHLYIPKASPEKIKKSITDQIKRYQKEDPSYLGDVLALPYGAFSKATLPFVLEGSFQNISYKMKAIFLVGSQPASAPYLKGFDIAQIPRVLGFEGEKFDLSYYLAQYDKNPEKRYISDGDPNTITIKKEKQDKLDLSKIGSKKIIFY